MASVGEMIFFATKYELLNSHPKERDGGKGLDITGLRHPMQR